MPVFSGFIFDMGGTLINADPLNLLARRWVVEPLDVVRDDAWFEQWVGVAVADMIRSIVEVHALDVSANAVLGEKRSTYRSLAGTRLELFRRHTPY